MYSIYRFTFPNGKYYFGMTSQKPHRRWQNGEGYKKCPLVYSAISKYGWENIKKDILFTFDSQEEALQKEKELIKYYNTTNPMNGYNLHEGGMPTGASSFLTEEGRQKIIATHTGIPMSEYTKQRIIEAQTGRIKTKEELEKISNSLKGREAPNRKEVYCLDAITEEIINLYSSACEAAKKIGKDSGFSNILKVCRGERRTAYGYKWKFKDE